VAEAKTRPTGQEPVDFIHQLPENRQADALKLLEIMAEETGEKSVMWGGSIIGFGHFRYRYASGHSGETAKIGFSPRKQALTLYLSYDLGAYENELAALGKHSRGKGCLYIKQLRDVDEGALRHLIRQAYSASGDYFDAREAGNER
jgi:hypothetical protein